MKLHLPPPFEREDPFDLILSVIMIVICVLTIIHIVIPAVVHGIEARERNATEMEFPKP